MFKFLFLFFVFFSSAKADLIVWQPKGQFQNWLLYKSPEESAQEAIARFLKANQSHLELQIFSHQLSLNKFDKIRKVLPSENVLLIANSPADHSQEAKRLSQVISRFQDFNFSTLTIPVGTTLSLSPSQKIHFFKEVNQHFDLLVALGGDDVHPKHYSEKITWAKNLKPLRDSLEIELIQNYFKNSSGRILGFCRGMQITSVALGYKLNQDLIKDLNTQVPHNNGAFHSIKLLPTTKGQVSQIFSNLKSVSVNSYHHQSVRLDSLSSDGYLQVAAQAPDGVVEALEGRDGRVILFQFHPEMNDLYSQLGHSVFEFFQKTSKLNSVRSCRKAVAK